MMRKCHTNTCPVGVATQDPELRKRFTRQAGVRGQLLPLRRARKSASSWRSSGFRTMDEMVGRSDLLEMNGAITFWKARGLDFCADPPPAGRRAATTCRCTSAQDHGLDAGAGPADPARSVEAAIDGGQAGGARAADPQRATARSAR